MTGACGMRNGTGTRRRAAAACAAAAGGRRAVARGDGIGEIAPDLRVTGSKTLAMIARISSVIRLKGLGDLLITRKTTMCGSPRIGLNALASTD